VTGRDLPGNFSWSSSRTRIAPPWSGTMSNPTPWPVTRKALKSVAN